MCECVAKMQQRNMIFLILLFVSSLFKGENAFAMWKKEHKNKKQTHHKGMCNAGISSSYSSRLAAQPTTLIKYKRGAKCSTKNINTIMIFCCFCLHCLFYSLFMAASLLFFSSLEMQEIFGIHKNWYFALISFDFVFLVSRSKHKLLFFYPQTILIFNYTFAFAHTPNGHHKMFYLTLFAYMLIATNHKIITQVKTWQCNFVETPKVKEKML